LDECQKVAWPVGKRKKGEGRKISGGTLGKLTGDQLRKGLTNKNGMRNGRNQKGEKGEVNKRSRSQFGPGQKKKKKGKRGDL